MPGEVLGVTLIPEHHSLLCSELFDVILADPNHKLHSLLPHKDHVKQSHFHFTSCQYQQD